MNLLYIAPMFHCIITYIKVNVTFSHVPNSALCKRDVGAGGQNFKKAIFHTFFIEYDKK